jgi:hypothetical protein
VAGDEVEQQTEAAGTRGGDQAVHILDAAERGVRRAVVGHVVAEVALRREVEGADPDRVHPAEPCDVVEAIEEARQVAEAVAVRAAEAAWIDLVGHRAAPPGHGVAALLGRAGHGGFRLGRTGRKSAGPMRVMARPGVAQGRPPRGVHDAGGARGRRCGARRGRA